MSCCGNCEMCEPELRVGLIQEQPDVIVLYGATVEQIKRISDHNPNRTIILRDWDELHEEVKAQLLKEEEMKRYYEKKSLEIETYERKEKLINQGRDQWRHRQRYHSK